MFVLDSNALHRQLFHHGVCFPKPTIGLNKKIVPEEILTMETKLTFIHSFEIHDLVLGCYFEE